MISEIANCTESQTNESEKSRTVSVEKRRVACTQTVQHLWDSILVIRQQKQVPNLNRISSYMRRKHGLSESDTDRQLSLAVNDKLIVVEKKVGCKGSKVGIEQEGYKISESETEKETHDWYCFECHRGGEVIRCNGCHRVYHSFCVKEDINNMQQFLCSVCQACKAKRGMSKKELNNLLTYTVIRLKEKTRELHKLPHKEDERWRYDKLVFSPMDLNTMDSKSHSRCYRCLDEFQADAQSIVHNVVIYYGVHSTMADMARQMLRDCIYDVAEIKQCRDCYRMSNEKPDKFWFCGPCRPAHELVFAKQKGFPYWPAKVIKQNNGVYDVRFFGGFHQRANIDKDHVKPIASNIHSLNIKRSMAWNKACEELRRHQELLEKQKQETTEESSDENSDTEEIKSECEATVVDTAITSTSKSVKRQVPSPEDANVVSSSSQETTAIVCTKATVATQTNKRLSGGSKMVCKSIQTEGDGCQCEAKYNKFFKEFKERLEQDHRENKDKALKELAEKLKKELEEEKQIVVAQTIATMQKDIDKAKEQAEEVFKEEHTAELCKLMERHKEAISDTKKKQWCYNCEAEAIYHCCWNTSYCSIECQQVHWQKEHKRNCRRKR